jgi:hypothetical protein
MHGECHHHGDLVRPENISGVKSRGAEINLFGKVTHDLSLNTGFIWAKATYPAGYLGTDGKDIGGTQLAYAPEYKFTVSGEYAHDLGENLKGFLAADAVWKSRLRYEANTVADTTFARTGRWVAASACARRTSASPWRSLRATCSTCTSLRSTSRTSPTAARPTSVPSMGRSRSARWACRSTASSDPVQPPPMPGMRGGTVRFLPKESRHAV